MHKIINCPPGFCHTGNWLQQSTHFMIMASNVDSSCSLNPAALVLMRLLLPEPKTSVKNVILGSRHFSVDAQGRKKRPQKD